MRIDRGDRRKFALRVIVPLALFALLIVLMTTYTDSMGARSDHAQLQIVEDSVRRAAVTCYAVEGRYPAELDYLSEHYGLTYDHNRYIVTYDAFASNVIPEIMVLERGKTT